MEKSEQTFSDPLVCVFPFEDGWTVACAGGHYAIPLTKKAALYKVRILADESKLAAIAIRNQEGNLERWLPVEALPTSMESHCVICKGVEAEAADKQPCSCIHVEGCKSGHSQKRPERTQAFSLVQQIKGKALSYFFPSISRITRNPVVSNFSVGLRHAERQLPATSAFAVNAPPRTT